MCKIGKKLRYTCKYMLCLRNIPIKEGGGNERQFLYVGVSKMLFLSVESQNYHILYVWFSKMPFFM